MREGVRVDLRLSKKHKKSEDDPIWRSGNVANLLLRIARKSENIDGETYYLAIKSLANFSQELDSNHHHSSLSSFEYQTGSFRLRLFHRWRERVFPGDQRELLLS